VQEVVQEVSNKLSHSRDLAGIHSSLLALPRLRDRPRIGNQDTGFGTPSCGVEEVIGTQENKYYFLNLETPSSLKRL